MKILYVTHQFYPESTGGTERFLLGLARAVQRRGYRAEVATYSMRDASEFAPSSPILQRDYVYDLVPVTAFRHAKLPIDVNSFVADTALALAARAHLSTRGYDLVHVVHPMRMSSFAVSAAELGIPYILTLTDFWTICPKITLQTSYGSLCAGPEGGDACAKLCPELRSADVKARLAETHDILRRAKAVVSPSHFAGGVVRKEFPDVELTVIPHGLRSDGFVPQEKTYENGSEVVFGYCGGLAPHKGVHLLISAFRSIGTDRGYLRIHGDAGPNDRPYADQLKKMATGDNRISFCGAYDAKHAAAIFRSLDVVVVPSLSYETYSFTLHEAMAAQVPAIVSATGALAEEVKDGENGLTFALGDEAALAAKLKLVVDNTSLLNSVKNALKRYAPPLEEEEAYLYERIYSGVTQRCAS